jgi:hypothetical protein
MAIMFLNQALWPSGKDFQGANLTEPAGADEVPGLAEALEKKS